MSIRKRYKNIDIHSDFCIMPPNKKWQTKRVCGTCRHEIFNGANRWKSIEDGLVIFLTPMQHTESKNSIHKNKHFREYAQWIAMNRWCEYYQKTEEDFRKRYGFCPIEPIENEELESL